MFFGIERRCGLIGCAMRNWVLQQYRIGQTWIRNLACDVPAHSTVLGGVSRHVMTIHDLSLYCISLVFFFLSILTVLRREEGDANTRKPHGPMNSSTTRERLPKQQRTRSTTHPVITQHLHLFYLPMNLSRMLGYRGLYNQTIHWNYSESGCNHRYA